MQYGTVHGKAFLRIVLVVFCGRGSVNSCAACVCTTTAQQYSCRARYRRFCIPGSHPPLSHCGQPPGRGAAGYAICGLLYAVSLETLLVQEECKGK